MVLAVTEKFFLCFSHRMPGVVNFVYHLAESMNEDTLKRCMPESAGQTDEQVFVCKTGISRKITKKIRLKQPAARASVRESSNQRINRSAPHPEYHKKIKVSWFSL